MRVFILVLLFSSCSLFSKKDGVIPNVFVSGEFGETTYTKEEIVKKLTKTTSMSGGNFTIKAFPHTKSYLKIMGIDNFEKTCFEIFSEIKIFQEASHLKDWVLHLKTDDATEAQELLWSGEIEKMVPTQGVFYGAQGKGLYWSMRGIACDVGDTTGASPINLEKGFELLLKAPYVAWPFSDQAVLSWQFGVFENRPQSSKGSVEVIEIKEDKARKDKPFRPYQKW